MKEKIKSITIVPVFKYGKESVEVVKDDFIKSSAEKIITVPALEGMIEKKLTKAGALNLLSKYNEIKEQQKNINNIVIGIPEEVSITEKTLRFLRENSNLLISPKNPINKNNFLMYEEKILIIDLHNYYHRIYYATPEKINPKGEAVTLKNSLEKLLKWANQKYDYIVLANDSKTSIRKDSKITSFLEKMGYLGGYKGKRKPKEETLLSQISKCNEYLRSNGYKVLEIEGYEADDVIASAVKKIIPYSLLSEIHILSSDKDLFQVIGEYDFNFQQTQIKIFHPKEKILMDRNSCIKKFGILPEYILDYFALVGDSVDSVPGAKGIGEKTAISLINQYGTLENIFSKIDEIDEKIGKKLLESKSLIVVSRDLIYLRKHLFESTKVEDILNKGV